MFFQQLTYTVFTLSVVSSSSSVIHLKREVFPTPVGPKRNTFLGALPATTGFMHDARYCFWPSRCKSLSGINASVKGVSFFMIVASISKSPDINIIYW